MTLRLGCIADDLTGATDLGITLAREGLSVIQVNGIPDSDLAVPVWLQEGLARFEQTRWRDRKSVV